MLLLLVLPVLLVHLRGRRDPGSTPALIGAAEVLPSQARRRGAVPVEGWLVASPAAWTARLTGSDRVVVIDLALRGYAFHVALGAVCEQLGIEVPADDRGAPRQGLDGGAATVADYVGHNIDREGMGDLSVVAAFERARSVVEQTRAMPSVTCLVIPPLAGEGWAREDKLFLRFLIQIAPPERWSVVFAGAGPQAHATDGFEVRWPDATPGDAAATAGWDHPLGLIPGLLPAALIEAYGRPEHWSGHLVPVGARWWVCLPGSRRRSRPAKMADHARLVAFGAHLSDAQRVYGNLRGYPMHRDFGAAARWAVTAFLGGGLDVAIHVLDDVMPFVASTSARARLTLERARMLVARGLFDRLADVELPREDVDPRAHQQCEALKAWGCVMVGRADEAHLHFERALGERLDAFEVREQFIYRNIWALAYFRRGELDAALAIEDDIDAGLRRRRRGGRLEDWPMVYVNSLNRARLNRALGRIDACEALYRRAFATTAGIKSDTDLFYEPFVWARVHAARAQWGPALARWVQVGLMYASMAIPEALGGRPLSALFRRPLRIENTGEEDVAGALVERLRAAMVEARGVAAASTLGEVGWAPVFRRVEDISPAARGDAFLCPQAPYVIGAAVECAPVMRGPSDDALRRLLGALLVDQIAGLDARRPPTVLVDAGMGSGPATTPSEAQRRAAFWGVERVLAPDGTLDRAHAEVIFAQSPAVAGVDEGGEAGAVATFRRYHRPVALDETELAIHGLLTEPRSLAALGEARPDLAPQTIEAIVRRLWSARVVTIHAEG